MNKKPLFGMVTLLIVSLVAAGVFAMRFGGRGTEMFANNDAIKAAIETGDYDAYTQAIEADIRSKAQLTEEQFKNLVEKYRQEAQIIEARQNIEHAIENNDYNAWAESMTAFIESQKVQITKENFDKIVQMHQQMQNKNWTTMKQMKDFGRGRFSH